MAGRPPAGGGVLAAHALALPRAGSPKKMLSLTDVLQTAFLYRCPSEGRGRRRASYSVLRSLIIFFLFFERTAALTLTGEPLKHENSTSSSS